MQIFRNLVPPDEEVSAFKRRWDYTDRGFKFVQWTVFVSGLFAAALKIHSAVLASLAAVLALVLVAQLTAVV